MAQFLRPDGDTLRTNLASGTYTAIDEVSPSDADYIQTISYADPTVCFYECSLSNPGLTPTTTSVTVRLRASASASDRYLTYGVFQGATQIYTGFQLLTTSPATYAFAHSGGVITDWNDVRIRCRFSDAGTGSATARLYWAELEVADGFAGYTMTASGGSFTLTGGTASLLAGRKLDAQGGTFALSGSDASFIKGKGIGAEGGVFALTGSDAAFIIHRRMVADGGSFAFTGGDATFRKDYFIMANGTSFAFSGGDVSFHIRERNGWDVPKYPSVSWSQAGGGMGGDWTELLPSDVDWTLQ